MFQIPIYISEYTSNTIQTTPDGDTNVQIKRPLSSLPLTCSGGHSGGSVASDCPGEQLHHTRRPAPGWVGITQVITSIHTSCVSRQFSPVQKDKFWALPGILFIVVLPWQAAEN